MSRLARIVQLRDYRVRRRVRDVIAEELFGDSWSLSVLLGINVIGVLVSVEYYVETMPDVPTLLWVFYADSAVAIALVTVALATLLPTVESASGVTDSPVNRPLAYLHTVAFVWLVKYGLWPLAALNLRPAAYISAAGKLWYWGVLSSHLLFVGLALVLPSVGRTTRGALAVALSLVLVNDVVSYGLGYHPPLGYEPGLVLPGITVGLSLLSVGVASRSFRRLSGET
ncbi:MAG: putative membrane protein [uncultured archaeon A07HR60]|nr:MAG: putative membrane protein [uncultured archaeon A07HR60]